MSVVEGAGMWTHTSCGRGSLDLDRPHARPRCLALASTPGVRAFFLIVVADIGVGLFLKLMVMLRGSYELSSFFSLVVLVATIYICFLFWGYSSYCCICRLINSGSHQ